MAQQQLDRAGVAARLGIQLKTVDEYRRRPDMKFPPPEGHIGRSPWWSAAKIDRWDQRRRTLPANRARAEAGV